jgi:hypothetical protein
MRRSPFAYAPCRSFPSGSSDPGPVIARPNGKRGCHEFNTHIAACRSERGACQTCSFLRRCISEKCDRSERAVRPILTFVQSFHHDNKLLHASGESSVCLVDVWQGGMRIARYQALLTMQKHKAR